jgi:hypothetical protein
MKNFIHIAIDGKHLTLCECCTCSEPDLEFQNKDTGLPSTTCPKYIELSKLSVKDLIKRMKNNVR